jgi:hypothetical protein
MINRKACKFLRGKLEPGKKSLGVDGKIIYDVFLFKCAN